MQHDAPTPDRPRDLAQEIGRRRPFELKEEEAYINLLMTHEALAERLDRLFKSHGLSQPQYNVLRILRGHRRRALEEGSRAHTGVPSSTIAAQLTTRVPDVTRLVDRLESAGLAKRTRSKTDRRVVRVEITPEGEGLLEEIDTPLADLHREQLGHLGDRKLMQLNKLLFEARHGPSA
ncbi:MAG: MarR family transcriptional regulator [Planctomycetota bacterium]